MNPYTLHLRAMLAHVPALLSGLLVGAALLLVALAAAVFLGGPRPIAALPSINTPFAHLDYSALPVFQRFTARDGTVLAYRHYIGGQSGNAAKAATAGRRIVLIHGSSASSRSMHPLAMALASAGYSVDALDIRGHGDSGPHGQITYIGQLEDDLLDFVRSVPHAGPQTLMGFSAGGGFVLRFAASAQSALFDRYVLLAPFLLQAPSNRPSNGDWAAVGVPRIVALALLNTLGVTRWNDLPVIQFALNDAAKQFLTARYSYALATNFGVHRDYVRDIAQARGILTLVAGKDDELMFSERYAPIFASAGKPIVVTLVPGAGHIGLTLNAPGLAAIVAACKA